MDITVIIPLYNKELYIQRAVESALHQTISADEILVIDDGSTDGSADVVRQISDARVRLIQQPNGGECAARNRGIREARNELVAFLDADDEWKPGFLQQIQQLATDFPGCGIYATSFDVMQLDGSLRAPRLVGVPPEPWSGILTDFFRIIQSGMPFFPSSVAASRQACLNVGGFPGGVKRGGDIMMWVRLGLRYPIAYSTARLVVYHTEALNRACDVYISLSESDASREIENILNTGIVGGKVANDLSEYRNLINIRKAKEILLAGNPSEARSLLKKSERTKIHRREFLFWYFWSMPLFVGLLPNVKKIYQKLRRQNETN